MKNMIIMARLKDSKVKSMASTNLIESQELAEELRTLKTVMAKAILENL
jgi:hypothetical protein